MKLDFAYLTNLVESFDDFSHMKAIHPHDIMCPTNKTMKQCLKRQMHLQNSHWGCKNLDDVELDDIFERIAILQKKQYNGTSNALEDKELKELKENECIPHTHNMQHNSSSSCNVNYRNWLLSELQRCNN